MDTDNESIPGAKLLTLPTASQPGDIWRLWAARSDEIQEDIAELAPERAADSPRLMINPEDDPAEKQRLHDQQETDQRLRDFGGRQERLLAEIEQRQIELAEHRQEIGDNALRLRDGGRVFVDGDRYRDEQGRVLNGADEAEAARAHGHQSYASTWFQKQEADRKIEEVQDLKDKILKDRAARVSPEQAVISLEADEKYFLDQSQARAPQAPTEYGSADYMADLGDGYTISTVPAFTQAANAAKKETSDRKDTGITETKTALRPVSHGALKL
jgi:hypothetical protein